MRKNHHTWAFTLVELIVVIVILSILSTIGYMSFLWILKTSRDSTRISDVNSIHKAITLELTKWNNLPDPDNAVNITSSGSVFTYQWDFSSKTWEAIGVFWELRDPLTKENYLYTVDSTRRRYQLAALDEQVYTFVPQSYAQVTDTSLLTTKWDTLGFVFLDSESLPIHRVETYQAQKSFDLINEWDVILSLVTWDGEIVSGTWGIITQSNPRSSCKKLIDLGYITESGEQTISEAWEDLLVYCDIDLPDQNFYTTIQDWDFENNFSNNWNIPKLEKIDDGGNTILQVVWPSPSVIRSNNFIYIQAWKTYTLSWAFKSAWATESKFYYGFTEYDEDFKAIETQSVYVLSDTETTLTRDIDHDADTKMYFNDLGGTMCSTWASLPLNVLSIAFNIDDSWSYDDLPNRNTTRNGTNKVTSVNDLGDECELVMNQNIRISAGQDYIAGTKIRAHRYWGTNNYVAAAGQFPPLNSYQSYVGTVLGMSQSWTSSSYFRKGTKYVKVLILPNHRQDSSNILHIDNLTLIQQ